MARFVELWKAEETADRVVYAYGPSRQQAGRIACTKADGAVFFVEPVPDVPEHDDRFFYRDLAMIRLQMLHRSGAFPDKTYVAT